MVWNLVTWDSSERRCSWKQRQNGQLEYSPVGRYLASLEGPAGGPATAVRVYTNWDDPAVDGAPLRPRIAARTKPQVS